METSKVYDYLHNRTTFTVPVLNDTSRESIISRDVKGNIAMVSFDLVKDENFKAGDEVTVDVRILITRKLE